MKYLRLASVAALVSAATVSAGPLGAREHDGYCPKGYTMSVYYKTVTVETYPTATSVASTVTSTSTPVTVESESSAEPTVASSSTVIAVETTTPVAVVQVETTTSSAPAVKTSAVETSTAETSTAEAAVVKTAPVVAVLPTSSAETAAVIKTIAAPAVETTAAAQTTTQAQAPVEVASTSTTQAPVEVASTSTSSATSSASTVSTSNKSTSAASSSGFAGKATFYGGNVGGGTCSFSGYASRATSSARPSPSSDGTMPPTAVPVYPSPDLRIVDQCPECESNHLDLFQDAFAELSDISAGIIPTTWSYVSCDLDGPLKLKNKEGTSAYWFSMQVVNANEAVTALEVSTDGGSSWKSTTRTYYNFFENSAGFGTSTVDVRITGASGKTVIVKDVGVSSGNEVTAGSNL
ncbi:Barwin-related endoglucanase [Penicillium expansum]|nr:Barwin-related endoglucanase [Penicillium expansum]